MKKSIYLIVLLLILSLVLTGCLLSNVGQVPTSEQSGITYLTKGVLDPDPTLVGLWHFDEGTGIIAFDSSDGNDGTVYGAADWVPGKFGNALSFDGDRYVEVPHVTILNPTSAITVECWAKLDRVDVHSVLVRKMNTYSLQVTVGLNGEGARLEGWVKIGGAWKGVRGVVGGTTLTSSTWYHFAFTYDGADLVTYVNGAFDRSNGFTGSIDSTTNMVNIGRCGPPETVYCYTYGIIDEVRIWDRALEDFEIAYNYSLREIEIDIKPGSDPNSINLGSKGVVPVAILSLADFDAATVDPLTVTLSGAGVKLKGNSGSLEDVNGDGSPDLVVQVCTDQFALTAGATEAVLNAYTYDGLAISGCDEIRIVPPK